MNLIDVDNTRFPNLALMKLSAYYKNRGYTVSLNGRKGDLNFVSCVFTKNQNKAARLAELFDAVLGGWGSGSKKVLSTAIEHTCPDYGLYPNDYKLNNRSIGFTSRGCIRKCKFCIVPEKEGKIQEWSFLSEFVRHRRVVLLDNNFLASIRCLDKLREMVELGTKPDFIQGLDIRLVNKKNAELLTKVHPKYLRFSFDTVLLEKSVLRGVGLLKTAGYPINHGFIGFYVLAGYNTTLEEDIYRCELLHRMDINTHVQVYKGSSTAVKLLARWANKPWFWTSCAFDEFVDYVRYKNQKIIKGNLFEDG